MGIGFTSGPARGRSTRGWPVVRSRLLAGGKTETRPPLPIAMPRRRTGPGKSAVGDRV